MMIGISSETLGAAKRYVDESLLGGGAVVGKNVTVSSITSIDGGNKVTFSYTLDDGTTKTSTLDVLDAYGVALKNGFIGTEEEWLESLKMDVIELEEIVAQEIEDQIGSAVEDSVTEQIEDNTATNSDIDDLWD